MIIYVDADTGNDLNSGTDISPVRSLVRAAGMVVPGAVIDLAGTFPNQRFRPYKSGTALEPITVRGNPAKPAVITNGLSGAMLDLSTGVSWYRFMDNITLDGGGNAPGQGAPLALAFMNGASDNVAHGLTLRNNAHAAIRNRAARNTLDTCLIVDVGNKSLNQGNGIDVDNGSVDVRILNTTVRNAGHGCLQLGGDQPADLPVTGAVVQDCTFDNPWATPLILTGQNSGALIERCKMLNGTREADPRAVFPRPGIEIVSSYNTIRHCTVENNAGGGVQLQGYIYATYFNQDSIGNMIYNNDIRYNGFSRDGYGYAFILKQLQGRQVKDNIIAQNRIFRNSGYKYYDLYQFYVDLHADVGVGWSVGSLNGNQIYRNAILRSGGFLSPLTKGEKLLLISRPWAATGNTTNPNLWYTLAEMEKTFPGVEGNVEMEVGA